MTKLINATLESDHKLDRGNKLAQFDLPTGDSCSSIPGGQGGFSVGTRLGIITFSEIVSVGMDHDTASDNSEFTLELDQMVFESSLGVTLSIDYDVSHITYVSVFIGWSTMVLTMRVVVGSGRHATVREICFFVDMESMFTLSTASLKIPFDHTLIGIFLDESHLTSALVSIVVSTFTWLAVWADNAFSFNWIGHSE